ncbi:hypothetical protein BGX34_001944 [Mortierella sp. NVP85]|nr:hypothetical protein BGX34_001944 [Mortierella sp. NVP85]
MASSKKQRINPSDRDEPYADYASHSFTVDDFDDDMIIDEDEFAAPSPTGEEIFDEGVPGPRFPTTRQPNVKVVDKNFFNDFPDLFDDDL